MIAEVILNIAEHVEGSPNALPILTVFADLERFPHPFACFGILRQIVVNGAEIMQAKAFGVQIADLSAERQAFRKRLAGLFMPQQNCRTDSLHTKGRSQRRLLSAAPGQRHRLHADFQRLRRVFRSQLPGRRRHCGHLL